MGQVKGHPLSDIQRLDGYQFPAMDIEERFRNCSAALDQAEQQGKYVCAEIFMVLFERMHSLHGFEAILCDLIADRPAMEALADRIIGVQMDFVRAVHRRFGSRVHGIGMTDDWGTQQAGFVSIAMWRDFFLPRYKRLYDLMHSCGKVNELIEGFIEAGVDAVNLLQPRTLGIEEIGQRYRGRILLESSADIQSTLPTGDRAKIESDVDALMDHWAGPDGGFVLCDYGDPRAIGVTGSEAKLWMYRRFSEHSERLYGQPLPDPVTPIPS
jgi:hypothetical protein